MCGMSAPAQASASMQRDSALLGWRLRCHCRTSGSDPAMVVSTCTRAIQLTISHALAHALPLLSNDVKRGRFHCISVETTTFDVPLEIVSRQALPATHAFTRIVMHPVL